MDVTRRSWIGSVLNEDWSGIRVVGTSSPVELEVGTIKVAAMVVVSVCAEWSHICACVVEVLYEEKLNRWGLRVNI